MALQYQARRVVFTSSFNLTEAQMTWRLIGLKSQHSSSRGTQSNNNLFFVPQFKFRHCTSHWFWHLERGIRALQCSPCGNGTPALDPEGSLYIKPQFYRCNYIQGSNDFMSHWARESALKSSKRTHKNNNLFCVPKCVYNRGIWYQQLLL